MRDGDWKYLKIRDNEYLFSVVEDPRERATERAAAGNFHGDPRQFRRILHGGALR
jgi:hypothetical protein